MPQGVFSYRIYTLILNLIGWIGNSLRYPACSLGFMIALDYWLIKQHFHPRLSNSK
jgi:hypothetical protein